MAAPSLSDIASKFLTLCAHGRVDEAYDQFVSSGFVHHNAYFPPDRQSLLSAMKESAAKEPNKSFEIKQVIESGDRIAVLSHLRREHSGGEYAVVHILRFKDGLIIEMWDIGQEIPQGSPNTLGMF